MNIHFFFEGAGGREVAASAFLATLLEQDEAFRGAFLGHVSRRVHLDPNATWTVSIEERLGDGNLDVALVSTTAAVLVENKVNPAMKDPNGRQLAEYYLGATRTWSDRAIVAVFLAPEVDDGTSEVANVRLEIAKLGHIDRDDAVPVAWPDVAALVAPDGPTFARAGMAAVAGVIAEAREHPYLDWTDEAFLAAVRSGPPDGQRVMEAMLGWLAERKLEPVIGHGRTGPLYVVFPGAADGVLHTVLQTGFDGWTEVRYADLALAGPFSDGSAIAELVGRLNAIPGVRIEADHYPAKRSSWIRPSALAVPNSFAAFGEVLDWIRGQLADG